MDNDSDRKQYELLSVIVNFGLGSKVIKLAKKEGVSGGTIFLGKGTSNNYILKLLDLVDIRKEIVFMISEKQIIKQALEKINKKLSLNKPNHGIAFTISVTNILGARNCIAHKNNESRGDKNGMYQAIFVIVDRGKGELVLDAANVAGSKGATIINARGSGIHETSTLFAMPIEAEKEMVLILSERKLTDAITSSVREKLQIDEPGNGIIFILDVNDTIGIQ